MKRRKAWMNSDGTIYFGARRNNSDTRIIYIS